VILSYFYILDLESVFIRVFFYSKQTIFIRDILKQQRLDKDIFEILSSNLLFLSDSLVDRLTFLFFFETKQDFIKNSSVRKYKARIFLYMGPNTTRSTRPIFVWFN
jgi:hypothetical protein